MIKKIMVSQPMAGFTEEQIVETANRFLEYAKKHRLEVQLILIFKMNGIQKML